MYIVHFPLLKCWIVYANGQTVAAFKSKGAAEDFVGGPDE